MRGARSNFLVVLVVLLLCFMPVVSAGLFDWFTGTGNAVDSEDVPKMQCEVTTEGIICEKDEWINFDIGVIAFHDDSVFLRSSGDFEKSISPELRSGDTWEVFDLDRDNDDFESIIITIIEISEKDPNTVKFTVVENGKDTVPVEKIYSEDVPKMQCEVTNEEAICEKDEWINFDIGVIAFHDDSVFLRSSGDFEKSISPELRSGDTWEVFDLNGGSVYSESITITIIEISEKDPNTVKFTVVENGKDTVPVEKIYSEKQIQGCQGCIIENICNPIGFRNEIKYCFDNEMIYQKNAEETCDNNFECSSNLCIDSSCVEAGLWKKIMNWFSRIF